MGKFPSLSPLSLFPTRYRLLSPLYIFRICITSSYTTSQALVNHIQLSHINQTSFIFPRRLNTIMSTTRNLLVVMFILASSIAYQAAARPLEEKPIFGASAEPLFPDDAGPVPPSSPSPCTYIPTPGNGHCNNH